METYPNDSLTDNVPVLCLLICPVAPGPSGA